jgi:hypothetical protein
MWCSSAATAARSLGLQIQLLFTEAAASWHRSLRLITLFKTEHEVAKSDGPTRKHRIKGTTASAIKLWR